MRGLGEGGRGRPGRKGRLAQLFTVLPEVHKTTRCGVWSTLSSFQPAHPQIVADYFDYCQVKQSEVNPVADSTGNVWLRQAHPLQDLPMSLPQGSQHRDFQLRLTEDHTLRIPISSDLIPVFLFYRCRNQVPGN